VRNIFKSKNPVLDGYFQQEQNPRSPGKSLRFITVVLQRIKYTVLRSVVTVLRPFLKSQITAVKASGSLPILSGDPMVP
jgi:hypothetical protein